MTYEELVEKVAMNFVIGTMERRRAEARIAIATVAEALMEPSDEMVEAGDAKTDLIGPSVASNVPKWRQQEIAVGFHAMLGVSPLFPKEPLK